MAKKTKWYKDWSNDKWQWQHDIAGFIIGSLLILIAYRSCQ